MSTRNQNQYNTSSTNHFSSASTANSSPNPNLEAQPYTTTNYDSDIGTDALSDLEDDKLLPLHSPKSSITNGANTSSTTTTGFASLLNVMSQHDSSTTTATSRRKEPRARGIARLTVHIPSAFRSSADGGAASGRGRAGARDAGSAAGTKPSKPRWATLEFKIYYLIALFAVPLMVWVPVSLSQESSRNYNAYAPRLSPGWIFGRQVDDSDAQYRSFRDNIPLLLKAAVGYLIIRQVASRLVNISSSSSSSTPQNRLKTLPFLSLLSLLTIVGLHGSSALKILFILFINFWISKVYRGSRVLIPATWVFNIAVLFANEVFRGYRFDSVGLGWLDQYHGVFPRWHVHFNITMLRLISFNMDYHWATGASAPGEEPSNDSTEKQRTSTPLTEDAYSFVNYIAYTLYPPLYIAGPIITFNDFMWQHRKPLRTNTRSILTYLFRFLVCVMTMELILHYIYVVAIKDSKAWLGDSPAEIAMIGFWNLIIVWLKLLIPWRFFRAWALLDGVDPPENMVRCMANNYSTLGFWRSWHRSYNLWIIRYIYIPLGGTNHAFINLILVFTFVALWHDLTFRLLAWGWLISLFVLPELVASRLLPAKKYGSQPWYRHVCAAGGVLNVLMMILANSVGFVVGVDGAEFLVKEVFGTWSGARFMLFSSGCLFVGVQLMFEYREEELRQGIYRRC